MTKPARLAEIETVCRDIGQTIKRATVGTDACFVLVMFTRGAKGWTTYVSDTERGDAIRGLEELLEHMRREVQ